MDIDNKDIEQGKPKDNSYSVYNMVNIMSLEINKQIINGILFFSGIILFAIIANITINRMETKIQNHIYYKAYDNSDAKSTPYIDPLYWIIYQLCYVDRLCFMYIDIFSWNLVKIKFLESTIYTLWKSTVEDFDSNLDKFATANDFQTFIYPLKFPVVIKYQSLKNDIFLTFGLAQITCICNKDFGILRNFTVFSSSPLLGIYFDPIITSRGTHITKLSKFNGNIVHNIMFHTTIIVSYLDESGYPHKEAFHGNQSICFQYCLL